MLGKFILFCVFSLLAAPAFATEAAFEKLMAHGVEALDAGNTTLAQEAFRAALAEHPADPEATLYLAIALNRANDPAAEEALKTALRLDPGNQRINLELGTFYYNRKMFEESGDYFDNLLALKPDSEMKSAAEGYLAAIRSSGNGKRWSATATAGMQYDSNVPLVADGGPLPVGVTRKGDLRGIFNLGIEGVVFRDGKQELTGSYSIYQTLHLHLADFDLTQNQFEVTYKRNLSPLLSAKIRGGFESVQLGGTLFDNDFSIIPGLFATFKEGMTTGIEYRFGDSIYHNTGIFPTNADRNGEAHSIILSHRQRLLDNLNLRLGYTFERDLATDSAWSSFAHIGNAGLAVSLPHSLLLDFSLEAATRTYDSVLAGQTDIRTDNTISGAAMLTWQASERLGVSTGYYYTNNDSNILGYQYKRGIASVMVQGRY